MAPNFLPGAVDYSEDCKDEYDFCPKWAANMDCDTYGWVSWMKQNCAKSCKQCTDEEVWW